MFSVPHFIPNGFTIQNLGVGPGRFYQPRNQNLSASLRGCCKPCSQNLGVSYRVFSSPVVRTSELVLESCTSHEFRNHFRPQWFYYSCSHNLRVLVPEGITSQLVRTCVLVP
jgi:hypothetical protein